MKKFYSSTGLVLSLAVLSYIGDNYTNEANAMETIAQQQIEAADMLRQQLPMVLDEVTTLVSTFSVHDTLFYQYNISYNKDDLDMDQFHSIMKPLLNTNVCENVDMIPALKMGAVYSYVYLSADGKQLADYTFDKEICGLV